MMPIVVRRRGSGARTGREAACMDRIARHGGLIGIGLVALVGGLMLLGRTFWTPPQARSSPPYRAAGDARFAQTGETVKLQGWEVTLLDFGSYERFWPGRQPASHANGVLGVADVRIKNIQSRAARFTLNDFALRT